MALSNAERQKTYRLRRNALARQAKGDVPLGPLNVLEPWRETVAALSIKEQEAAWRAMNKSHREWRETRPAKRQAEMGRRLDDLVVKIRGHVFDAGCAYTTQAKHQLQAGWRLLELRERIEAGEAGQVDWWEWFESKFNGHIKRPKICRRDDVLAKANE